MQIDFNSYFEWCAFPFPVVVRTQPAGCKTADSVTNISAGGGNVKPRRCGFDEISCLMGTAPRLSLLDAGSHGGSLPSWSFCAYHTVGNTTKGVGVDPKRGKSRFFVGWLSIKQRLISDMIPRRRHVTFIFALEGFAKKFPQSSFAFRFRAALETEMHDDPPPRLRRYGVTRKVWKR